MKTPVSKFLITVLLCTVHTVAIAQEETDPLPSWNDGPSKSAILEFVNRVTDKKTTDFVPAPKRVATFDNDGTLWVEQPLYTQIFFAVDRVKALAPKHPDWKTKEPFKSVLEKGPEGVLAGGKKGLAELMAVTHAGMTADEFNKVVSKWIKTAKHPVLKKKYTQLVYQPQLELIKFLKKNKFKVFIVSGGGIEFMRPWTGIVYGIPPAMVVGSSIKSEFQLKDGKAVLVRLPEINFIDDKAGKPVGIYQHIGLRPILAFGNSDGDLQMLQYTTGGKGPRLGLIVHHTDAKREFAYDRDSKIGKLDKALDLAKPNGWIVVDMKNEWKTIFPKKK